MTAMPTLLLVHGAWHGPWVWEGVQAALEARGLDVRLVDLPSMGHDAATLGGLSDDAATVAAAAAGIAGPVIVVAHSYAGMAVTEADMPANVVRLVYVGAFMPAPGMALASYLPPGELPPFVRARPDGASAFDLSLADHFLYADCPAPVAEAAKARLRLHSLAAVGQPVSRCSWQAIPFDYVVLTEDRVIPPQAQNGFAAQAVVRHELASSHSPMLSMPDALAGLLAETAAKHGRPLGAPAASGAVETAPP